MNYFNKKTLLKVFVLAFCLLLLGVSEKAHAGTSELSGWAWSSNIGWISFNSKDTNAGGGPYAVTVATTSGSTIGTLGGYAWSSNIGWIKFGALSSFPNSSSSNAQIDFSTGKVTGWARACSGTESGTCTSMTSRTDGWDGWISLSGTNYDSPNTSGTGGISAQGITLGIDNTKPAAYGKLTGFSWGGDVVGWVSFSPLAELGGPTPPCTPGTPGCGIDICTTPPCGTSSGTPAFTISGSSLNINRENNASGVGGILVSGGLSGTQSVAVSIRTAMFTAPTGVTVSLLDGNNNPASSVVCSISSSADSCSLPKIRVEITNADTAPESFTVPIVGIRSGDAVEMYGVINVVIPRTDFSDLSLWGVEKLPGSAGYNPNKKLTTIPIKENEVANIAWENLGVEEDSCVGTASGTASTVINSLWKNSKPAVREAEDPFIISGLTKGDYKLKMTCLVGETLTETNEILIKVIKSNETEF